MHARPNRPAAALAASPFVVGLAMLPLAPPPTAASGASSPPTSVAVDDGGETIDGMFDVGGHELYLHCEGSGSPTILYLHGSIVDANSNPVANAGPIQRRMRDTNRFCAYDRRNVGASDTVDEVQTIDAVLSDLDNLLDAADLEPPYVLLGASFGGLLAYVYANTHPDEVTGMVLLDSMFPDEMSLEYLFPAADRYEAFAAEDAESLERIVHYDVQVRANEFVGSEPEVPVIYMASALEPWNEQDYGIPEYDARILDVLAGYVDRFAPGKLVWVDSPHFMEPVIPEEISDALREVIGLAGPE